MVVGFLTFRKCIILVHDCVPFLDSVFLQHEVDVSQSLRFDEVFFIVFVSLFA